MARADRRWSWPSSSSSARQPRAGPRQLTRDIVPRSSMCAGPAGTQLHRPHDPGPVPPGLRQLGVLAPVDDHHQLVLPPRAQAARLDRERRVGIGVAPDAAPVQEHARVAADALEAQQPAEPARGGRPDEAHPVAAHLARIQRGQRACVEHARHGRLLPLARRLGGHAGRCGGNRRPGALGRGLLRGCRLGLRRGGRGHTHLPPARERLLARRRGERRRGQRGRCERDAGCHEYAGAPHHGHHRSQM